MNQVLNVNNKFLEPDTDAGVKINSKTSYRPCLDVYSRTGYRSSIEFGSKPDFDPNNINKAKLVYRVLVTKVDKSQINKKKSIKAISLI